MLYEIDQLQVHVLQLIYTTKPEYILNIHDSSTIDSDNVFMSDFSSIINERQSIIDECDVGKSLESF